MGQDILLGLVACVMALGVIALIYWLVSLLPTVVVLVFIGVTLGVGALGIVLKVVGVVICAVLDEFDR